MKNLRFGDIVELQSYSMKINKETLAELQKEYGRGLTVNQLDEIREKLFEDDYDLKCFVIENKDLEINRTWTHIAMIVSKNDTFGYYCSLYSEHNTTNFSIGHTFCQTYDDKSPIYLDKAGKDFEDYEIQTKLKVIRVLSEEEKKKYVTSDFYENLK